MSQRTFLADLDARLHEAFASAGMADTGTYTAPGSTAQPARVYVEKSLARLAEYGEAYAGAVLITLLRADVPAPVAGAVVHVDGSSYILRTPVDSDDGISMWSAA